jgi:hypothetical protein
VLVLITVAEFDPNNEFDATLDNEGRVDTDTTEVVLVDCEPEASADIVNTSDLDERDDGDAR